VRQRIPPGTVGPVSLVPIGTAPGIGEEVVPAPLADDGSALPYPSGWKTGRPVKVTTREGVVEYTITRWRGLARLVDVDGSEFMIRRWRDTKAAAEAATIHAGLLKLAELEERRERLAASATAGDTDTTVGDLLDRVPTTPAVLKLAPRTREGYLYTLADVRRHAPELMAARPRDVDVAAIRTFMHSFTLAHGASGAARAKALLRRGFDLAVESTSLRVPFNPVSATREAIPAHVVRHRDHLQKRRVPTDEEVTAFLAALRADPEAGPLIGPRHKSRHGAAGTAPANPVDVADLLETTFTTGMRIGEASALRWGDLHLVVGEGTASVTGTVGWLRGEGTIRQPRTKTAAGERLVPLSDSLVETLLRRVMVFGIDLESDQRALPVFPSPQAHDRWRNPSNLMTAIRKIMDRYGLEWASSHTARRWRVTSLLDRGVPLGKVADAVGHADVRVTLGYIGRGRGTDSQVRAAL
jgi:integrase